jgi:hypothetical protein
MPRAWKLTTLAIVMGCGAMIAAQEQPAGQSGARSQTTTPSAQSPAKTMITGCVQRADGSGAIGTTGAAGGATASTGGGAAFMLTNATLSTGNSTSAAPGGSTSTTTGGGAATTGAGATTTGTTSANAGAASAPSAAGTSGSSYMLDDPSNKLTAHVGHKVEVTGTLAPAAGASATATAGGASASATTRPAGRLQVTDVKMIATDCSAR